MGDFQRNQRVWPHVAGHFVFAAAMLSAGLLLLQGGLAPMTVTIIVAMMWAGLAFAVIAGIAGFLKATDRATSENRDPFEFFFPVSRVSIWVNLLILAGATAALFAAGEPILAAALETYLLLRLVVWVTAKDMTGSKEGSADERSDSKEILGSAEIVQILIVSSALWLALGTSLFWLENMLVTAFWLYAMVMVVGAMAQSAALQMHGHKYVFKGSQGREEARDLGVSDSVTPDSARSWRQRFVKWLRRAAVLIVTWGLWTAGYSLPAFLYFLGALFLLSADAHERRLKQGDSARIDIFAHAVHAVIHWPLVIVGAILFFAITLPLSVLGAIYDRITGAPPPPASDSERDERVRQARIRRAAASYRLRAALDRPVGFVYFMSSEPHQRDHFLGPGSLLADLGNRVVVRDYRKHVLETRTSYNWQAFEQAPEGALLHVNGISNMRRDLPFVAVVPPYGTVRVFRLCEPYRARKRDGGAALSEAESEICAAIAETLGLSAGEAKPC